MNDVVKTWLKGTPSDREGLRRTWPGLADQLDAMAWSPDATEEARIERLRTVLENSGANGRKILDMTSCDGCRTLIRMAAKMRPGNEEDHYQYQRALSHHRKECPNK